MLSTEVAKSFYYNLIFSLTNYNLATYFALSFLLPILFLVFIFFHLIFSKLDIILTLIYKFLYDFFITFITHFLISIRSYTIHYCYSLININFIFLLIF